MDRLTALVGELDLDELEAELNGWLTAYPLAMFPEPDLTMAAMVLKSAGMTLDSISASNMRHVANQIAPKALALIATLKAQRDALEELANASEAEDDAIIRHDRMKENEAAYDEDELASVADQAAEAIIRTWKAIRRARASIEGNPTA